VGKLYNIAAQRIARDIVAGVDGVEEAQCYLVSRIGYPVSAPQAVDLRLHPSRPEAMAAAAARARALVQEHLDGLGALQDEIINGAIKVY
jgi:S-adenosylmethionine synthetase